jgi:hypothetical protein
MADDLNEAARALNAAQDWPKHVEPNGVLTGGLDVSCMLSLAISAKRQADALERIADSLERRDLSSGEGGFVPF